MDMPECLEYWTADSVAECLSYEKHLKEGEGAKLGAKLWGFLSDAKNPPPLGGDGSNGTVETPDGQLDLDNDDKTRHWWHKLSEDEQRAITLACKEEGFLDD